MTHLYLSFDLIIAPNMKYDISAKTTSVVCGNSILPEGKLERNEIAFPLFIEITIRIDSLSLKFVQGSCERLISH